MKNQTKYLLVTFIIMSFFYLPKAFALTCVYKLDNYNCDDNGSIDVVDELKVEFNNFSITTPSIKIKNKPKSSDEYYEIEFNEYIVFKSELEIASFYDLNKRTRCPDLFFSHKVDYSSGTQNYEISDRNSSVSSKMTLEDSDGIGEDLMASIKNSNYKNICIYDNYVIKLLENDVEANFNYKEYNLDVSIFKDNEYQCPNYMCINTITGYMSSSFSEEKISGFTCHEGVSFAGCIVYNNLHEKYSDAAKNYNSCLESGGNSCPKHLANMREYEQSLKSYCSNVLNNRNFNHPCTQSCLEFSDEALDINPKGTNECGFSNNLAAWIRNIVNWARFLIPLAVIILSILDFIKAMAGDKDDDMKKAQGKFVKRLIAAALVFIIPSIIMFILDKMGFADYVNGCGIIDLDVEL